MSNNNIRRPKWTPPPPPTPRILQLPRRIHRRKPPRALPSLATYGVPPVVLLNSRRRGKVVLSDDVEDRESTSGGDDVEERESNIKSSKLRFEAEMLRAECYLLRMEREVAVKKLESERSSLHRSLKSAVYSLVSGKKKISEGENVSSVIEEEIEELSKKLVELQRRSSGLKSPELQNCSNFDKQASELQKQLEEYNEMNQSDVFVEELEDLSGATLSTEYTGTRKLKAYGGSNRRSIKLADVEKLRRKMERLSKGKLLKRMEEVYGSMLSASNCSIPSSATSSRRFDLADLSSQLSQEAKSGELKACSGQCKAIVKRLMEQVKAETQQWSQMQEMLGQVREEMEELQSSRDFWQANALKSDHQIQTLHSEVEELKQKAVSFENKESKLQKQVQELLEELEKSKVQETCEAKTKASKDITPISLGAQLAKEKRPLTCRVKQRSPENKTMQNKAVDYNEDKRLYKDVSNRSVSAFNRLPFKDIGNVSHLERHNSRRYVYPLHNPKKS